MRESAGGVAPLLSRGKETLLFAVTAGIVVFLDLLTKHLVFANLETGFPWQVLAGALNFTPTRNPGAVFGIGAGMRPFFIAFTVIAIGAIVWALRAYGRTSPLLTFGLGFLMGGAIGNLWDRIAYGEVRDFIDFYVADWHWHTFNIADAAICTGCAIVILHAFRNPAPKG